MIYTFIDGIKRALGRPEALRPAQLSKILEATMPTDYNSVFAGRVCWRVGNVVLFDPYRAISAPVDAPVVNKLSTEGGAVSESPGAAEDSGDELSEGDDWEDVKWDETIATSAAPLLRDDVEFNVTTGEVFWNRSTLPELIKAVATEFADTDFRVIIALPEKRETVFSSVGHYTTLVIDRHGKGINAVVLDSQAMSGLKGVALSILRHKHINPDHGVREMIKDIFGEDVSYSRQRYNHQAEVLDTSCGYFTAKMMQEVFKQSIKEDELEKPVTGMLNSGEISASIADRWGVALTTLDVFLTESDITTMRAIAQSEIAQMADTGGVESDAASAEAIMRDGASASPPPAERETLSEGDQKLPKTPD